MASKTNRPAIHRVDIHSFDKDTPYRTKILIDGEPIRAVGYSVYQSVGELPRVSIDILPVVDTGLDKCIIELGNIDDIARIINRSQLLSLIDRFNECGKYKKVEIKNP